MCRVHHEVLKCKGAGGIPPSLGHPEWFYDMPMHMQWITLFGSSMPGRVEIIWCVGVFSVSFMGLFNRACEAADSSSHDSI